MKRRKRQTNGIERLIRVLRDNLPGFGRRYGVKALGLFGSRVNGSPKRRSDLDVLVEFRRTPTLLEFVAMERELGELLEVKVDLVMKSALKPEIGRRILAQVVPV
ncbi:MAG: nucleotidyltransferase family protein [Deltaproteobacteria bacterium]|nr:nucleotidyltransferase family protein [Deltaproteobacteria bacterium]